MPNTLAALCPKCQHARATPRGALVVNDTSVLAISCPNCGHAWSIPLPLVMRDKLADPPNNE
jgi:hypothetical protein